jgi:GntR family transcriptional regulator
MFHVKVDRDEPLGLHEQVAAEVRRAIADGEARPGERLPPARDLAAVLGVNTNTVLRALRLLRDEGLLDFRRGRGITVASTSERGAVIVRAKELVEFARSQGYRREDLIRIIETLGDGTAVDRRRDAALGQRAGMSLDGCGHRPPESGRRPGR